MDYIELPIRHGEGKFYSSEAALKRLADQNQIVFQYCNRDRELANGAFPANPNGSLLDIAGVCDPTGRILGMMPHPEAYNNRTNHPNWTERTDSWKKVVKAQKSCAGEGLKIFINAVTYMKEKLVC